MSDLRFLKSLGQEFERISTPPARRRRWPLIGASVRVHGHLARVLVTVAAAAPVVVVAGVLLLAHSPPTAPQHPGAHHDGLRTLQRAFPVLTRPLTSADLLPPGLWFGVHEPLEPKLGRLVLHRGRAKMWLIPTSAQTVCLIGTAGLTGGGCTTQASAELRGFFSADVGPQGAIEVEGMLPRGASAETFDARGRSSTIHLNQAGAFGERLAHPAQRALITTSAGNPIPIQLPPLTRLPTHRHSRSTRSTPHAP